MISNRTFDEYFATIPGTPAALRLVKQLRAEHEGRAKRKPKPKPTRKGNKNWRPMTDSERETILLMHVKGEPRQIIARALDRAHSTVSKVIRENRDRLEQAAR